MIDKKSGKRPAGPLLGRKARGFYLPIISVNDYPVKQPQKIPPVRKTAKFSGDFLWNAGIFIWKVKDIIEEFRVHLEDLYIIFEQEYKGAKYPDSVENITHIYSECPSISIDFGVMEKSSSVYVLKGEFGWSDVGTWHSFHEISPKDENDNVVNSKNIVLLDAHGCIVNMPKEKKVIIEGISNCIVAENNDILMICQREHEDNIRHYDDLLKHKIIST